MSEVTTTTDVVVCLDPELNVAQLRMLFVCVLEGRAADAVITLQKEGLIRTEDEVVDQAYVIRNLSTRRCFFGGEENLNQTGWFFHPEKECKSWSEIANVACSCLDAYRGTRRTLFPDWEKRLPQIADRVHSGVLAGSTVLYTDRCSERGCGELFKVTAKNAAAGYAAFRRFSGWTRCPACEKKLKLAAKLAAQAAAKNTSTPTAKLAAWAEGLNPSSVTSSEPTMVTVRRSKNVLAGKSTSHRAAHGWPVSLGEKKELQDALSELTQKLAKIGSPATPSMSKPRHKKPRASAEKKRAS